MHTEVWFYMGKEDGPGFKFGIPKATEIDELAERARDSIENWKDKKDGKFSNEKLFELLIMRYVLDWKNITNKVWNGLINHKDDVKMKWGIEKDGTKKTDENTLVPFKRDYLEYLSKNYSIDFLDFYTHCQKSIKKLKDDERLRELDDLKN